MSLEVISNLSCTNYQLLSEVVILGKERIKEGSRKIPRRRVPQGRRGEGTKQRREEISKNCEYDADEVNRRAGSVEGSAEAYPWFIDDDEVAEIAAKAWKFPSQSYEDSFISSQHL